MLAYTSLLFLAAFLQLAPTKLDAPTIYERSKPALVHIKVGTGSEVVRQGSGVILRSDGLIATNFHVIEGARQASVRLANGDEYTEVAVAAVDEFKDIALLKIKAVNLPTLELADSDVVKVGQTAYALGDPLGLEGSLSQGMVSAFRPGGEIHKSLEGFRVIQFTAPVSPGNSGGPLLNEEGKVIGLVFAFKPGGQNLNLAVPANYLSAIVLNWKGQENRLEAMPRRVKKDAPTRTPAEILASAKTIYIRLTAGNPVLKSELSESLMKWGKLTLVSSPDDADLVLEVVQTGQLNTWTGEGNQAAAILTESETGVQLWSKTKGGSWAMSGWSNAWVARALAKEFIKFFDSTVKTSR